MKDTVFKSAAAAHPAMVDAKDAPEITIPILLLPSSGEDKKDVAEYEKALKVKHEVEWYDDQVHGFMAARYVFLSTVLIRPRLTLFQV